jgi:hypothetical protein
MENELIEEVSKARDDQEERWLLTANNFDSLTNKNKVDQRSDWYFPTYRIRHTIQKGPNINIDTWQKIDEAQGGLIQKKKTEIKPHDENLLDKKALFRIDVLSKRPTVNERELYLEKVRIYRNGKFIKEFVTTETEGADEIPGIKTLVKLPQINSIKRLGPITLKEIVTKMIK